MRFLHAHRFHRFHIDTFCPSSNPKGEICWSKAIHLEPVGWIGTLMDFEPWLRNRMATDGLMVRTDRMKSQIFYDDIMMKVTSMSDILW